MAVGRGFSDAGGRREQPDRRAETRSRRIMPRSLLLVRKGYRSRVSRPNARVHGSWAKREGESSQRGIETVLQLDQAGYG
jgi:hypothetical protein